MYIPRQSATLHRVCKRDVIAPDVILPLLESQDAAEDAAGVDAHTHVQIDARRLAHVTATVIDENVNDVGYNTSGVLL